MLYFKQCISAGNLPITCNAVPKHRVVIFRISALSKHNIQKIHTFTAGNEIVLVVITNRRKAEMGDRAGMSMAGQRYCLGSVYLSGNCYQHHLLSFLSAAKRPVQYSSICNDQMKGSTEHSPEDMPKAEMRVQQSRSRAEGWEYEMRSRNVEWWGKLRINGVLIEDS